MTTNELLQEITGTVRTNGSGAITGAALQQVLTDMAGAPQVVQLGGYPNDNSMDSAVKDEALRVPSGSTGGVYVNKIIYASSSGSGNQTNYTYFTLTSGGAVRLVRAYGSAKWMVNVYADGAWGGWANYEPGTAVMDVGQLANIEAFVERLRQYDVLHSGAVVVVTSIPGGDYMTRQFCFQVVNPGQGTARQFLFGKQTGGGEFDGVFVRDLVGVNALDGASAYDWERTMAQKFWLNGKKLEVGDYSSAGSGTGNVATVDLSSIAGGGGGGADPDAFVGVASYGRGDTLLEMSFSKSGGGTYETELPMATGTLAGIMSGSDKAKLDEIDLEGKKPITDLGTFNTWALLRTSIVGSLPAFPAVAKVANMQVLLLCDDSVSGGAGTRKVFAYDSAGVLYALGCKLSGGRATWDADWTVTDLTTGGAQSAGMSVVNAAEYNTGSVSVSGTAYVAEATDDDIEAASSAAVVWIKRFSYGGQPAGDLTGKGGRFYLRLSKDGDMTYYGAWPAVSAAVPGDEYYNQAATTGKAARVGMLFYFAQDGQVRFRAIESDVDSLAVLGTVSTLEG